MDFKLMVSLLLATITFAHLPARMTNTTSTHVGSAIAKRWYSVDERVGMTLPAPYVFAWPVTCSSPQKIQPIRYCFRNARSARNLQAVLDGAIRIWAPAMAVSGMRIIPDPACDNQDECVCTRDAASVDSLVISDETKDGDLEYNQSEECITETTIGYEYIPRGEPDRPWRHALRFSLWDVLDPDKTMELAIRGMAHELGTYDSERAEYQDILLTEDRSLHGSTSRASTSRPRPVCDSAAMESPELRGTSRACPRRPG